MDQDRLRRRYHALWTGEAVSSALFAAFLLWFAYQDGVWQRWIARTYSVGVVILILLQGIVWWRAKLRLLDHNQRQMPRLSCVRSGGGDAQTGCSSAVFHWWCSLPPN